MHNHSSSLIAQLSYQETDHFLWFKLLLHISRSSCVRNDEECAPRVPSTCECNLNGSIHERPRLKSPIANGWNSFHVRRRWQKPKQLKIQYILHPIQLFCAIDYVSFCVRTSPEHLGIYHLLWLQPLLAATQQYRNAILMHIIGKSITNKFHFGCDAFVCASAKASVTHHRRTPCLHVAMPFSRFGRNSARNGQIFSVNETKRMHVKSLLRKMWNGMQFKLNIAAGNMHNHF